MARKPRPIDPAEGSIPAFAYDLRKVRDEAGEPTYRALASVAGFGATTLSDAAGGVRFPSLEVTLAYVGACGGDVALWERRWHELDAELAAGRPEPAATDGGEPATTPPASPAPAAPPATPDPGGDGVPEPVLPLDTVASGPRAGLPPWVLWSAAATALTLVAVLGLIAMHGGDPGAAGPSCPAPAPAGPFAGTTYLPNTVIRAGASLGAPVVAQAPAGCALQFTGFCLGDVVVDVTSGTPDTRWFKVATGGVVSSAVVHGNPPDGLQPSGCPDAAAPPAAVRLSVVRPPDDSDTVELAAAGRQLAIIGFAAYFAAPDVSGKEPAWQQIGLSDKAGTGFAVPWRLGPLRRAVPAGTAVPVVAVACLGGGAPTAVLDARAVPLGPSAGDPPAAVLGAADLLSARQAACRYPQHG